MAAHTAEHKKLIHRGSNSDRSRGEKGQRQREGGKEGGKEPEKPRFLREGGEKRERGVGQTGPGTDRGGGEREKVSKM